MKISSVFLLAFGLALVVTGCANRQQQIDQDWANYTNAQTWAVIDAERKFRETTVKSFLVAHPCPTTNAPVEKIDGCQGRQLGLIVPASCGGQLDANNLAWLDEAQAIHVKQLEAQCNMQQMATMQTIQAQQAAAASMQGQMQNALFYNDMTRILGSGIYNMMK